MNPEPLFNWINERHRIYLKRQAGEPWPWTSDEILKTYRFCNVFRELDTVTVWIREHWREPFADHCNLWFAMCLARQINWPDTLAFIQEYANFPAEWNPNKVYEAMRVLQHQKKKVYTGAYMLKGDSAAYRAAGSVKGLAENNKPLYTVYKILDNVWEQHLEEQKSDGAEFPTSIQRCVEWLERFHGWGGFLAYEVATDLRHTRYLCNAPDIMTWANPGPGAKRGLNRLYKRELNAPLERSQAILEMQFLLSESPNYLHLHVPALEMRDIEHSLCETDKWLRVKNGEGRPRSLYHPPIAIK